MLQRQFNEGMFQWINASMTIKWMVDAINDWSNDNSMISSMNGPMICPMIYLLVCGCIKKF